MKQWTIRTIFWLWLVACSVSAMRAQAAEWQWSIADGNVRAYLWIPPGCQRVRAVMVANHNMIEQGIMEHPVMRAELARLGIAEIWTVQKFEMIFDFNKGAGEHYERIAAALADESGYQELKFAPVIPLGHSACATYPWNFAAWNPGRTLAVLSVHGDAPQTKLTGYGRANVEWGDRNIDGVPGLMVMGEYEWWEDRLTPAFEFRAKHPKTPLAFLADAGRGHFDYSDDLVKYLAMFVRKAAEQRLPAEADLDKPVVLKPIDPEKGWRIDRWRKDAPPTAPAAPYAAYAGNPKEAFWCFDEEMARATEELYARQRGKKPQLIAVYDTQNPPQGGCGEPVTPRFLPMDDGVSFRLSASFLDTVMTKGDKGDRWTGLAEGSPIGHATGGGPIQLSWIVGPAVQTGPDTFSLCFNRQAYTSDRRNSDIWLVASHPGDEQYKSIVQQIMVRVRQNTAGAPQTITFPPIADQHAGVRQIKLAATSDSGLPVHYYVREGPAEVEGDMLTFTAIPPRSRFPIRVTVVAWQWGRSAPPQIQTAKDVEVSFVIIK